jgi:hypothetical protein
MKTKSLLAFVAIALVVLVVGVQPARAAFSNVNFSLTCSSYSVSGNATGGYSGNYIWVVIFDNDLSDFIVDAYVPLVGGSFSYSGSFSIDSTHSLWVDIWDEDGVTTLATGCTNASFSGPGIPGGFVMKTITCDVVVFDAPGGKPVGSNAIKSGQTWYVNPTPKKDAAGKAWTEIFVAGYTNGYVPTSCVH